MQKFSASQWVPPDIQKLRRSFLALPLLAAGEPKRSAAY
jgi:hypothetical protein